MNPGNETPSPPSATEEELITSSGIARELRRSTRGVIDTLKRLNIKPEMDLGAGGRWYKREVIATVDNAMRAPNTSTTSNPSAD